MCTCFYYNKLLFIPQRSVISILGYCIRTLLQVICSTCCIFLLVYFLCVCIIIYSYMVRMMFITNLISKLKVYIGVGEGPKSTIPQLYISPLLYTRQLKVL